MINKERLKSIQEELAERIAEATTRDDLSPGKEPDPSVLVQQWEDVFNTSSFYQPPQL
jgi:hypothetical protein